jgi:hypothetical protein
MRCSALQISGRRIRQYLAVGMERGVGHGGQGRARNDITSEYDRS